MPRLGFYLTLLIAIASHLYAYGIKVENVTVLPKDISARQFPVSAPDGSYCALIRVQTEIPDISIAYNDPYNDMVRPDSILKKIGELWVYVPTDVKKITFSYSGQRTTLEFKKFGIKKLEERTTYNVDLSFPFFFLRKYYGDTTPLKDFPPGVVPGLIKIKDNHGLKNIRVSAARGYCDFLKEVTYNMWYYAGVGKIEISRKEKFGPYQSGLPKTTIKLYPGYVVLVEVIYPNGMYGTGAYIKLKEIPIKDYPEDLLP